MAGVTKSAGNDKRARWKLICGTACVLGLVGFWLGALVLARGLCCYDDASFAVVSRNLAEGRGYSLPFRFQGTDAFVLHKFEALTGTGPTSIIPVAGAIWLFGAQGWVPGGTHVVLELSLLALLVGLLGHLRHGTRQIILYLIGSLSLVFLLSALHLGQ